MSQHSSSFQGPLLHTRPKLARVTTFLLVGMLFIFNLNKSAQAQPVHSPADISSLQKQLLTLQHQLASIQDQQQPVPFENNSRVKSVGSQRVKKVPETVFDASLHIRLYDLSDLFAVSPSYPAMMPNDLALNSSMFSSDRRGFSRSGIGQGGGVGGGAGMGGMGGGGVFSIPPEPPRTAPQPKRLPQPQPKQEAASLNTRSAQVSMDQLVNTVKETVEPEMWGSGRDDAKVQFLGNTLLITATEDMHTQINNLLNLFREHWGKRRTITIQTYWIRAGAADAADLLDQKSTNEVGAGVVNASKWDKFIESAKEEKRFAYSAALTGHNNQTLHALSGQQRQLTLDAIPFETTSAQAWFENIDDMEPFGGSMDEDEDLDYFNRTRKIVGFRPVRQSFHNGAAIQVTPLATRGGNFVILDVHAKANELTSEKEKKPSVFVHINETEKAEVELDHGNYVSYRLNTTVRCPKEQIVLAGGMTYDPSANEEHPNLYLFVKASVHTITEDESDWVDTSVKLPENSKPRPAAKKKSDEPKPKKKGELETELKKKSDVKTKSGS